MEPKYIYNSSDIGYMDEEWKDYPIQDNNENENITKDDKQDKEIY